ncbi:MAG TPA: hypothetical protein VNO21_08065, partial [Polyangiaceae bacterium]|nr:hypothetical protein [Polyangiaceae bacterium]
FICQEDISRLPAQENAGCETADGYEVHAQVEYLFAPGHPPETYAVEPLRAWRLSRCGASRAPVTVSPSLRRRVAPALAVQPSRLATIAAGADFAGNACPDNRLTVRFRGVHHTFVPPTVHRFELDGDDGEVTLLASGHDVRNVRVTREPVDDGCTGASPRSWPWSFDLEVICAGTFAVVSAYRWRFVPPPSCLPRGGGVGSRSPAAPRCSLLPKEGKWKSGDMWSSSEAARVLVHLETGVSQPIAFSPVDLRP